MSSIDNIEIGCKTHWDGEDMIVTLPKEDGLSYRLLGAGTVATGCGDNPQIEYQYKGFRKEPEEKKELLRANFQVTENWTVECPHCLHEDTAPFNNGNPMQPMTVECCRCLEKFILTYDRD
jgi:uncharacterized metal-binding protein YceD (DUF177 family)